MFKRLLANILAIMLLSTMSSIVTLAQADSLVLYVSPTGNDSANGGLETPFKTLEKARDTIRSLKATSGLPDGGVTVFLREGAYNLTSSFKLDEKDSGEVGKEIVYRAYKNEKVRMVGGGALNPTAFTPVSDKAILAKLPIDGKDKVLQIDLKAQGITEYGEITKGVFNGLGYVKPPQAPELFFNGKALTVARYPNEGFVNIGSILVPGSNVRLWQNDSIGKQGHIPLEKRENPPLGFTFTYVGDRPNKWASTEDVWMRGYWTVDWYDDILKVDTIDVFKKSIKTVQPSAYQPAAGQRYYYFNLLEELDAPGEWYLDRKSGMLYVYPTGDMTNAEILLSNLATPLFELNNASNIQIRGMSFEASRLSGVNITSGENNLIYDCTLRLLGDAGVKIDGGKHHGVVGCEIYDNGSGGVQLSGGNIETLESSEHYVENNNIHSVDRIKKSYSDAVQIWDVGTKVMFNELHNADHELISFNGNDITIQYNYIHDAVKSSSDAGVIYTGRTWVARGNMIKNNYIKNIAQDNPVANASMVHAIYFDDLYAGTSVEGNIFNKIKNGVFINGGRHNNVIGNIFMNVDSASKPIEISSWGLGALDGYGISGGIYGSIDPAKSILKLNTVAFDKAPYTKYGDIKADLSDEPAWPKYNVLKNNVYYKSANGDATRPQGSAEANDGAIRKRNTIEGNASLSGDLGFTDEAKDNLTLKDDSIIFKKVPEFEKIPFEKIGRYTDKVNQKMSNAVALGVGEFTALVNNKEVFVDETNLSVSPVIIESRTLLPVRFIAESFGAKVGWDADTQEITVTDQGKTIKLKLGSNIININGNEKTLDVPAQSINSRTFIPLRALAEAMGKKVFWDDRELIIISNEEQIFDKVAEDYMINDVVRKIKVN